MAISFLSTALSSLFLEQTELSQTILAMSFFSWLFSLSIMISLCVLTDMLYPKKDVFDKKDEQKDVFLD